MARAPQRTMARVSTAARRIPGAGLWLGLLPGLILGLAACDPPSEPTAADAAAGQAPEPEPQPGPDMPAPEPEPEPEPEAPGPEPDACVDDADFFAASVQPILAGDCIMCHREGGAGALTRFVMRPFDEADAEAANQRLLAGLVVEEDGFAGLLLDKPTNVVSHGGGRRFEVNDPRADVLRAFVRRSLDPEDCVQEMAPAADPCAPGTIRPGRSELRRLTDSQFTHSVADIFGVDVPPGLFPATVRDREFRTWPVNNTVSAAGAESIMLAAEYVASRFDVASAVTCAEAPADCGRRTVVALARRAFRRPLRPAESALLDRVFAAGLPAETAVRQAVELLLQSPQFLYVADTPAEPSPAARADGAAPLDAYALAARLSFFLADTAPDAALIAAAEAGELSTRAQIAAHARRLVADPRVRRGLTAFHRDWLDVWRLQNTTRDPERYPGFGPHVVESMLTELDLYVTEVVWAGDGRFDSLLYGDVTWVDRTLAATYGLPDPGEGWHRVRLDDDRPGILTRSAFLAAHAYAGSSSPVQRGAFVLHDLFCETLSPPQDVNMDLPEPTAAAPTIRERLEQHWTAPACRACHTRIDPLGFAFEHFGALGEWRDTWEDGTPIDASGDFEMAGGFDGAAEMIGRVGTAAEVRACYATRWFEYAVGRPAEPADACTVQTLAARFAETDGDIRNLLVDITLTDAFRYRPLEGGR